MNQTRCFGIIYLLLSKKTMTAKELAEYFEVSTRTIYRDIDRLSEMNIPIYMTKGKNGGIALLENYRFDKALLSEEEQNQILFSLQSMNKLRIDYQDVYEKCKAFFAKAEESWFDVDFSVWGKSDAHNQAFQTIKNAILDRRVIEFTYYNAYGKKVKRKVEPLKLCFRHQAWYLRGFDQVKEEIRFFKLMRMKEVKRLNERFERADKEETIQADRSPQTVKLVLRIETSQAYRVYDEFDEAEITDRGTHFLIMAERPFNDWIYGYLLSFGEHLQVLEPEFVKKEIIEKCTASIKNYS